MPKTDRSGRIAAFEILKANARTRECIEKGERENKSLLETIKAGALEGMQHFDGEIAPSGRRTNRRNFQTGAILSRQNPAALGEGIGRKPML